MTIFLSLALALASSVCMLSSHSLSLPLNSGQAKLWHIIIIIVVDIFLHDFRLRVSSALVPKQCHRPQRHTNTYHTRTANHIAEAQSLTVFRNGYCYCGKGESANGLASFVDEGLFIFRLSP